MPCQIKNPANYDLGSLENHVHGMYDHFDSKYGFKKPPTMVFDSDPNNQSKVLGKTAYYDPQSLEIHVFVDGRHPKDILRSIAHELIHHRQNMESRLDTGGYSGPGYYLENDELKEVEHEAMLEGNATMREYEDTVKYKENEMSLKEWKNNELNKQLLKKFGILKEGKMPMKKDTEDLDGDGKTDDKVPAFLDKKDEKSSKPKKGEVPPQLQKHVKGKKEDDKEEMEEGRNNPRTTNSDKFAGHEDRYLADRIHEEKDDAEDDKMKAAKKKKDSPDEEPAPSAGALQEALKKIARAKRVYLGNKRVK
jgi:hypothetical protein